MSDPELDPLARLTSLEGVASAMAATRDGIDALLRDRGLRRTPPELTAESLLRGAWASATLEGSGTLLDELRTGGGDDVARSALRMNAELLRMAPLMSTAPLQAFARLHALVAKGDVPDDELGRPVDAAAAARLR